MKKHLASSFMNDRSSATTPDSNDNQRVLSGTYQQAHDLQTTQSLLRATLDSSMDMIQVFVAVRNEQAEILDFTWILNNHAAEKIYGDVLGKSLLQLQPGVVEEGIFAAFKHVVETGQPQQYEKHYRHEQFDGWFFQSIVKLGDGVATTTADITDRKNAEQALQQSKALLQDVIDGPNIGIAVYKALRNNQGQIIDFVHEYINRASLTMLGGEDFTGKLFSDHGQNGIVQLPQLIDVIETGIGNSYLREAHFRGRQVWFAITNSPLDGDRLVHTWEDITQRQKAEEESKEQAHFIQRVTQMMPDVVSVVEFPSRTILYTNRDTLTWVGFDADELSRMSFDDRIQLFHPDDLLAIQDFYGRFNLLKDREETSVEYRLKNKKGDWILLSLRGQVFRRDEQGAATQLLFVGQNITAQRQAEQEILRLKDEVLQSATDKYRSLFDSIDEGFCIVEVILDENDKPYDLLHLEANPAYERYTGLRGIVGKRSREIIPEAGPWLDFYGTVALTGQAARNESYLVAPIDRWIAASASRIGGEGSLKVAIVFDDITERKRREANLAFLAEVSQELVKMTKPEETLEVLGARIGAHFKTIRVSFVEIFADQNKAIVRDWHGPELSSVAGQYPLSQFLGEPYRKKSRAGETIVIPDAYQSDLVDGQQLEAVFGVVSFINIPLVREGQWVFTLGIHDTVPREWRADEIEVLQELTARIWTRLERVRAEQALRDSQKRFESITNLVPDLLWESEPDGSTNWYNQRWLAYTGQRFDEAIGWGWTEAIHPDDRASSAKHYGEAVEAGQSLRQQHRIRRHDGAYRWFVVSASPLLDKNGQVIKMYGAATDIHDLKRLQTTLLEADRRKDEFLAMMAHELRNPLAPIRNGLQLVAQTHQADQVIGTLLPIMNRQMDHLMRMLDDLLDVSRISRGKIDLHKKQIDLTQVVAQAVEALRPLYTSSGRQLSAQLPDYPLYLDGDPTRLHQMVTNLLTNSLRYTHEGGQVWLSLERVDEQALLRVRDNGIGIAADQLEAIFELFVQVDHSLARSHGGLGLGLSLVQDLVRRHGGRVEAHSQGLEQGSEFVVYLPILSA